MKNSFQTDHTLIIDELETSIKFHNLDLILGFLPKGSYLVGGYIRDIILGRKTEKLDVDIVVPLNAIEIGKKIADNIGSKFIILDEKREVVRIILNHIYIDITNQICSTIEGDLISRDFSINSIAFLFEKKRLFDPFNGLKDLEFSLIKTYSEINLINDELETSIKFHNLDLILGFLPKGSYLSLIHISEPTRLAIISYAVFCL